ncbi:MAG: M20/M25/M40 family metallo-hydrolase [Eubacteriales bacterium]|nr:M20/M25/M40 family metallo-hydrolase [Eubacteriales bacterium]
MELNEERIIKRFTDYVKITSPSRKEAGFANVLMNELRACGCTVFMDNAGEAVDGNCGNLIAYKGGSLPGDPILFSAHMDTVTPCEHIEPQIDDGIFRSAGDTILSGDDKAGVVAILEALHYLNEHDIPHRNLEIVFTICEEVGLLGSKHLDVDRLFAKTAYVLDGDGAPGAVTVQSPAHGFIRADFTGLAKHAGLEPENGISAIQMAADAISRMTLLRIDSETSANVGTIHGGAADNIVAESCTATFEARSLDNDKVKIQMAKMKDILKQSAERFGGNVDIHAVIEYPAIALQEEDPVLIRFRAACEEAGFTYRPESSGGGADASNFVQHGIPAATVGVGMKNVHSVDEYLAVQDLLDSVRLTVALMRLP